MSCFIRSGWRSQRENLAAFLLNSWGRVDLSIHKYKRKGWEGGREGLSKLGTNAHICIKPTSTHTPAHLCRLPSSVSESENVMWLEQWQVCLSRMWLSLQINGREHLSRETFHFWGFDWLHCASVRAEEQWVVKVAFREPCSDVSTSGGK